MKTTGKISEKEARTIVVVEKKDNVAKLIANTLNEAGFHTKLLGYGSAAIFYVLENNHSLLLMEYFLPDMTAKEVLQGLKANNVEVPFIIMSSPGNEKTIIEMMKMGSRDFLVKEQGFMDLLPSSVSKVFRQLSLEDKLASTEFKLQTSKDRFKHIFDSISDGIFIYDFNGNLIEVNQTASQRLGYNPEEMAQMSYLDLQPYDFSQNFSIFIHELKRSASKRFQTTETGKEGNLIPVECEARIIEYDGQEAVLNISRDVTEQKKINNLLTQHRKRIHRIAENISDYIMTVAVNNRKAVKTKHGANAETVTGYKTEELEQEPYLWLEIIDKRDKDFVLDKLNRIVNGEQTKPFDYRILHKDGHIVWLRNTPVLHFDNSNNLVSYDCMIYDITQQKNTEEKLIELQARLDSFETAFDSMVYICSPDNKIKYANEKLIDKTGYDPVGKNCYKVIHNRDSVCPWCVNEQVQEGETVRWEMQSPHDKRWYSIVTTPIYNNDGSVSKQFLISDITDKIFAKKELDKLNNLYFGLVEEIETPVCRFNLQGKLISANRAFCKMFAAEIAQTGNEASQKTHRELSVFEYLNPSLRDWTKKEMAALNADRPKVKKKFTDSNDNQKQTWIIKAIFDAENNIIEFQGIIHDPTVNLQDVLFSNISKDKK